MPHTTTNADYTAPNEAHSQQRPRAQQREFVMTETDKITNEPHIATLLHTFADLHARREGCGVLIPAVKMPSGAPALAMRIERGVLVVETIDGSGTRPWVETDATAPLNVYGQTKLEGERLIQAHCTRHLIFRTSWVYAAHGSNFVKTMLKLAQERERLTVIDDQWGAPTGAELIAAVTATAIEKISHAGKDALAGIYHVVAGGETSWHAYAMHVIGRAKALRPDLPWAVQEIAPVPSSAFVTAARRPHNSRLNTAKLKAAFGINLPDWQQGVNAMLAQFLTSTPPKEGS